MDWGNPRVGGVSYALLSSLGPREFLEKWSAIVGQTEFPFVTDSSLNNSESTFFFPPATPHHTDLSIDQMSVINV